MNKLRTFVAAIALVLTSAVAFAQTTPGNLKIGYTNVDYVLSQMPESKQIEADLKAYGSQLEAQLQSKYKEYETKAMAYEKGATAMTDVVRADKEKELVTLRSSIEEFQKNADASLQNKQQSLLKPALDKLQKSIDEVAKENGYTYIFNSDAGYGSTPILLFSSSEENNISDLILKKMGVTPGANKAADKPAVNNAPVNKPATTPAKKSTKKK
jgi:outer membrane protein